MKNNTNSATIDIDNTKEPNRNGHVVSLQNWRQSRVKQHQVLSKIEQISGEHKASKISEVIKTLPEEKLEYILSFLQRTEGISSNISAFAPGTARKNPEKYLKRIQKRTLHFIESLNTQDESQVMQEIQLLLENFKKEDTLIKKTNTKIESSLSFEEDGVALFQDSAKKELRLGMQKLLTEYFENESFDLETLKKDIRLYMDILKKDTTERQEQAKFFLYWEQDCLKSTQKGSLKAQTIAKLREEFSDSTYLRRNSIILKLQKLSEHKDFSDASSQEKQIKAKFTARKIRLHMQRAIVHNWRDTLLFLQKSKGELEELKVIDTKEYKSMKTFYKRCEQKCRKKVEKHFQLKLEDIKQSAKNLPKTRKEKEKKIESLIKRLERNGAYLEDPKTIPPTQRIYFQNIKTQFSTEKSYLETKYQEEGKDLTEQEKEDLVTAQIVKGAYVKAAGAVAVAAGQKNRESLEKETKKHETATTLEKVQESVENSEEETEENKQENNVVDFQKFKRKKEQQKKTEEKGEAEDEKEESTVSDYYLGDFNTTRAVANSNEEQINKLKNIATDKNKKFTVSTDRGVLVGESETVEGVTKMYTKHTGTLKEGSETSDEVGTYETQRIIRKKLKKYARHGGTQGVREVERDYHKFKNAA